MFLKHRFQQIRKVSMFYSLKVEGGGGLLLLSFAV